MTDYGELIRTAIAAVHALRSYQYGNASPELAEEVANELEYALKQTTESRCNDLETLYARMTELQTAMEEMESLVSAKLA